MREANYDELSLELSQLAVETMAEIGSLVNQLGFVPNRENNKVSEIFNQTQEKAEAMGLESSVVIDLTTGWDLSDEKQRDAAEALIDVEKPALVVGRPRSSALSQLWAMTRAHKGCDHVAYTKLLTEAMVHLRFCVKIYKKQQQMGRLFLHEHP